MAVSAAEYILNELYWTDGNAVVSFAYPLPSTRSQIHNANLLAPLCCVACIDIRGREILGLPSKPPGAQQEADGGRFVELR